MYTYGRERVSRIACFLSKNTSPTGSGNALGSFKPLNSTAGLVRITSLAHFVLALTSGTSAVAKRILLTKRINIDFH